MVKYTDQVSGAVHLYKYDALGRRIGKVVDSTGLTSGPTETRFYYGGKGFQQVIEEQDELGTTQATYVYGMYIDDTVQMRRQGQDYYYHCDDLYNTMAITDSAGVVVERYEYGDYGQVAFRDASGTALATQASAIGNPYTFTGRRFDEETGLYWYRTKYYDSAAGRFTSRDSIGIWGDIGELGNGLTYVGNNPWTHTDPFGLFIETVWDAINVVIDVGTSAKNGVEVIWGVGEIVYHDITGNDDGMAGAYDGLVQDAGELGSAVGNIAIDGAATLIPGLPAGLGRLGSKADDVLDAAKIAKKTKKLPIKPRSKKPRSKKPKGPTIENPDGPNLPPGPHDKIVNERRNRRNRRREREGQQNSGQNSKKRKKQSKQKRKGPRGANRGGCDPEEAHRRIKEGTGGGQR